MRILLLLAGVLGTVLFFATRDEVPTLAAGGETTSSFYGNGQLRSTTTWEDGTREGEAKEWHPDGSPASAGNYREGVRDGAWTFWLPDGSVDASRSGDYVAGKRAKVALLEQQGTAGDLAAAELLER